MTEEQGLITQAPLRPRRRRGRRALRGRSLAGAAAPGFPAGQARPSQIRPSQQLHVAGGPAPMRSAVIAGDGEVVTAIAEAVAGPARFAIAAVTAKPLR